jgi:hypothetical protein
MLPYSYERKKASKVKPNTLYFALTAEHTQEAVMVEWLGDDVIYASLHKRV